MTLSTHTLHLRRPNVQNKLHRLKYKCQQELELLTQQIGSIEVENKILLKVLVSLYESSSTRQEYEGRPLSLRIQTSSSESFHVMYSKNANVRE